MHSFHVELLHGVGGTQAMDRLAELREPNGRDQALFADMGAISPVSCVSTLLANLVLRIGNGQPAPDQLSKLTVGDRERILLALCSRLLGAEAELVVSCPGCRELVEIQIRFRDLISARPGRAVNRCSLGAGDGAWAAELAPPTGADRADLGGGPKSRTPAA